jgi:hypothetical protein
MPSGTWKITESGGVCGNDAGKKVKGRKRHIMTDTLGFLLLLLVHSANIQDRDGTVEVFKVTKNTSRHCIMSLRTGNMLGQSFGMP